MKTFNLGLFINNMDPFDSLLLVHSPNGLTIQLGIPTSIRIQLGIPTLVWYSIWNSNLNEDRFGRVYKQLIFF